MGAVGGILCFAVVVLCLLSFCFRFAFFCFLLLFSSASCFLLPFSSASCSTSCFLLFCFPPPVSTPSHFSLGRPAGSFIDCLPACASLLASFSCFSSVWLLARDCWLVSRSSAQEFAKAFNGSCI
ncbi:hypothetical protein IWX90DRAFT_426463 [Phyllosticta citrichinensis]|uniref:Uncharacterized protein n=1 Tax=Phyllosticta citrichinensis TaxID=1130410 RepID=A0ABR1XYQ6_9PEZI